MHAHRKKYGNLSKLVSQVIYFIYSMISIMMYNILVTDALLK